MGVLAVHRRGVLAVPTGFNPASISGLQAWYDASQLTGFADGDPIGSTTDFSGNSRHATQSTGSKKPVYKTGILNGRPVMRFDGVDDVLSASFTLAQPLSVAAVVKSTTTSGQHHVIDGGTGTRAVVYQKLGEWYLYAGAETDSGIAVDTTNPHVLFFSFDNTSRPEYVDGVAGSSVNPGSGGYVSPVNLGSDGSGFNFWSGDIAEVLVYNTALSTGNRTTVQTYLKTKWGTP
jgi:hypothetical protein